MAYFAELNDENIVLRVIAVDDKDTTDSKGIENEEVGIAFCKNLLGGKWIQTSFNANIRKNYAGIGFFYNESKDAFIPIQPFTSWALNEETCRWECPIAIPQDGKSYHWDEASLSWLEIQEA